MRLTFLSENKTERGNCMAEFGLSIYIETKTRNILFDAGQSALFSENAARLGIDLGRADICVVSHAHFDHTNGIPRFCEINKTAPVYIHKDAFCAMYGTTDGEIDDYNCGILWSEEQKSSLRDRLVKTEAPLWLDADTVISGTIPDIPEFKPAEDFYIRLRDGSLAPDNMNHEQFLAVRGDDGVYLFSGCSHKGIIAAVEYCKTLFPGERTAGIIAGMHLFAVRPEMRAAVIDRLYEEDPGIIIPVHCTGLEAIFMMKSRFRDRCLMGTAGRSYEF